MFRNRFIFYGEGLLAPRPTPKLEDHPLSSVHGCLFNVARMGKREMRIGYLRKNQRITCGRFPWKAPTRPLGRPRRRWVDNIKMDLLKIGWGWCGLD
jgi:hypothetical protein